MSTLDIRLFGAIEIRHQDALLTDFRSQKALALLAYLICQDRPVTREHLAGLAWPEMEQSQALGLLRRTLHDLTSKLPDCLVVDRRTVHFQPLTPVVIDVRAFAKLAAQDDPAAWAQAVNLYRAPLLEGIYLDEAPDLESWLLREQEQWQQQMIALLDRLMTHHTATAAYHDALRYARRLVALEPWREEAHQQVMLLLARTGQISAALAHYGVCRLALQTELGIEPSTKTESLYTRIQIATTVPLRRLPPTSTPFVGRADEVAQLVHMFAEHHCRLITIVGPGGIGKSRFALELARAVTMAEKYMFLHGAAFAALADIDTPEQLAPAIAQALAFTLLGKGDPETQLLHYLQDKELLLVLDNFEQLISADALTYVRKILESAPDVRLLITSRVRLNLHGEQLYWLQGLQVPPTAALMTGIEAANYSAVALFLQAAHRVLPGYQPSSSTLAAIVTICQHVQGMPLALELAAAWMSVLRPDEIANAIDQDLDFLASEAQDLPLRLRSMRAVFATSWRLLMPDEQAVFQQLAIFRGGFTRTAAQLVAKASLPMLMRLAHKSFLGKTTDDRFVIHELIRQYGVEILIGSVEIADAVRNRHSAYYTQQLAQWAVELKGARQQSALTEMEVESSNLRAAWEWAVIQERVDLIAQAVDGLSLFYRWRNRYQEGETACRTAYAMLCSVPITGELTLPTLLKVTTWLGVFCQEMGDPKHSRQLLEEALRRLDNGVIPNHGQLKAAMLLELGNGLFPSDRVEAVNLLRKSLAFYKVSRDQWGMARSYLALGEAARNLGDYQQAQALADKSLQLCSALEDARGIASALDLMSLNAMDLGDLSEATRLSQQQMNLSRSIDDSSRIAKGCNTLGLIHMFQGRFAESIPLFEEGLRICHYLGLHREIGATHVWLGGAKGLQGRYLEAIRHEEMGLAYFQEGQDVWIVAHAQMMLGWLALSAAAYTTALEHLQRSRTSFEQLGQRDELSQALAWLSYAELGLEHPVAAKRLLIDSLQISTQVGTILPMIEALPALALLFVQQGQPVRAVELYALAARYPMVSNTQLLTDIAGRKIANISVSLPPDVVKVAQERGAALDLSATVVELLCELESS